jgi:hypothetical protein
LSIFSSNSCWTCR